MRNTFDKPQLDGGDVGVAVYSAAIRLPAICPPAIDLELESGFHCAVDRSEGDGVQLTLGAPSLPDEWPGSEDPLAHADDEAERVVAALCFHYACPFSPPVRQRPVSPNSRGPLHFDTLLPATEALWPSEETALVGLLHGDDPRAYPLWTVLASIGGLADPLAQYVALWGLLDIGRGAKRAADIDHYLFQRFRVPRDCPNQDGKANAETRFTHLRHQISHPAGRGVGDVAALSSAARPLVEELTGLCRLAICEGFV
jgi:hypothetical protein